MAKLNMDLLRKKKQALKDEEERRNRKKGGFKPKEGWFITRSLVPEGKKEGKATVRLITPDDGDAFREYFFHYLERGKTARSGKSYTERTNFLCLDRNFDEECPGCAFASDVWSSGKENGDKAEEKAGVKMFAKARYFSPVLVRGEEDKGAQIWAYGGPAYESFVDLSLNPEYGDITDVDVGRDINITYKLPSGPGAYADLQVLPGGSPKPLAASKKELKKILDSLPDIDTEVGERKTAEEIEELLAEWFGNPEDGNTGQEKYGNKKSTDDPVQDAIDDLDGNAPDVNF